MKKTITILPETNKNTLFLEISGRVTLQDYMENFDTPVYRMVKENGWYNLYVHYDRSHTGWDEDAAAASFKCISECGPKARRLAYVNPPDSRRLMMRMLDPIMHAEMRFFEDDEQEEAKAWMVAYKAP